MSDPQDYFTICLLPWVHLDNTYEVGGVRLLQYPEYNFPHDFQNALIDVPSSYKEIQGDPVSECTLVALTRNLPEWELDSKKDDLDIVQESLSLFFLAAMSCNEYFCQIPTYSNSSAFQPIFQNMTIPTKGHAVQYRKRDGSVTDMGYKHGDLKYSRPLECKSLNPKLDENLLKGLDSALKEKCDLPFVSPVIGITFIF